MRSSRMPCKVKLSSNGYGLYEGQALEFIRTVRTPLTRSKTELHIIKQRISFKSAALRSSLLISSRSLDCLNERSRRIVDCDVSEKEPLCVS